MPRLPDGQHFEQRCRSTSKSHPICILCKCCHASGVIVRMATRRRSTGQVTWKTVARQSVESLWQQESIRFEESWTHLRRCSCRTPESSGFCSKSAGSPASPARTAPASSEPVRGEGSSRSKAGAFAKHNLAQKGTKRASCPFRVSAPNSQRAFVSALQRLARASWQQSSGPNMADAKLALAAAAPVATPCRAPLAALQAPIWQCVHASQHLRQEYPQAGQAVSRSSATAGKAASRRPRLG